MARIGALVSPAIRAAWLELAPQFERAGGHVLATEWAGIAAIRKRIGDGEVFDLVVGSEASIDELVARKRLAGKKNLARAETGVGVRQGARRARSATPPARAACTSPSCSSAGAWPRSWRRSWCSRPPA